MEVEEWRLKGDVKEQLLSTAKRPVVFRRCLDSWTVARRWSPLALSRELGARETTFKLCPRRGSEEYRLRFGERETVFETQCQHVRATFLDFAEWLEAAADAPNETPPRKKLKGENSSSLKQSSAQRQRTSNPLLDYPPSRYWVYADYKYMSQLCDGRPELIQAIDWGVLGFTGRGGADSTLWVGSEGAYTPCHYDTYGCNLVAQLWGQKKWTLFSPGDSAHLYPTRIPYEESSVFSEVNVVCPDLERHPDFTSTAAYQVELEAGDVLFVPRHWWHYVECTEEAVSVNTWIDLPSDPYDRVKEAVVRTMIAGWLPEASASDTDNAESSSKNTGSSWINPNEEVFPHEQNLELLSMTVAATECQATPTQKPHPLTTISHHDWVTLITSDAVVETLANTLIAKHTMH